MGAVCSCCSRQSSSTAGGLYEPLLQENEREAVADLLEYLENRNDEIFFEQEPLRALTTLSYSDNVDLHRSAALAFAEITERHVEEVGASVLDPLLHLLKSSTDVEVQRAASAALGNLAVNVSNKLSIVRLGGLDPLVKHMLSPNIEVQCNAVGCITNLATHEENKNPIARSGALTPLTKLARNTKDIRVQRNATGALLNMTHSEENRRQVVEAGGMAVIVYLLKHVDADVVYYCTTALSNLAVDALNRKHLLQESQLVSDLVELMESPSVKIQCQAALALRNLASDETFQLEIARHPQCLPRLLHLISGHPASHLQHDDQSNSTATRSPQLILASVACIRNISIHPQNETKIIQDGFLKPLVTLLDHENEEIQCHAISTLRNLAAGSGGVIEENENKECIAESGALEKIKLLVEQSNFQAPSATGQMTMATPTPSSTRGLSWPVLSEMTACLAVLALSDKIKVKMLAAGMVHVLIPLTFAHIPPDVQGNAAAALGNLATKTTDTGPFLAEWDNICAYLERFLEPVPKQSTHYYERDEAAITFQHIAIWTLLQFCEKGDQLKQKILQRPYLSRLIEQMEVLSRDEEVEQLAQRLRVHLGFEKR